MNTSSVESAERILVPKGDDREPCIRGFQEMTGIEVPTFKDEKLTAMSQGKMFYRVKGKDIPELVVKGCADVGLTGTDSIVESGLQPFVVTEQLGPAMCRFALLAKTSMKAWAKEVIPDKLLGDLPLAVVTSYPRFLSEVVASQNIRMAPSRLKVSGSIEAMLSLTGLWLAADMVASGETARQNDLVDVYPLSNVYPEVITRREDVFSQRRIGVRACDGLWEEEDRQVAYGFADIQAIDERFRTRADQVGDQTIDSYTLRLMRDVNLAGKKAGEEVAEIAMAIFGDGDVPACEGELADLIYAQMAAAYSKGKPVSLSNVMQILIDRNNTA